MKRQPVLLIHCQYVYGIGHFVRATELARSLRNEFKVHLITGGEQIVNFSMPEGVTVTQIQSIYKDEKTGALIPTEKNLSLEECFTLRENEILQLVQTLRPDIVITEHFPFGLLFEDEAISMLKLARQLNSDVMIVSSIRDVIDSAVGTKQDAHICSLIEKWFDLIIIHGDPRFITLNDSFPLLEQLNTPHIYTGYVVAEPELRINQNGPPILVGSIGGGRLGRELFTALIYAHKLLIHDWEHELILFKGAFESNGLVEIDLPLSIQVKNFDRNAYREALALAHGVICLGGYNSVSEALSMRVPALVYRRKFIGSNHEQALRIDFFKKSGLIKTIEEEDLDPKRLTNIIKTYFTEYSELPFSINFNGAENSCRILQKIWQARREGIINI